MSDGLTVPFALAAGISGAIAETHLVVTAGLAEIAAGSIAMGLGGYLAAKSVTLLALFCFGIAKGYFTGTSLFKSGFQTVFVGGMAAGAAYLLAKAIS